MAKNMEKTEDRRPKTEDRRPKKEVEEQSDEMDRSGAQRSQIPHGGNQHPTPVAYRPLLHLKKKIN